MLTRNRTHATLLACGLAVCLSSPVSADLPSFQDLVDAAGENAVFTPPPGIYAGPVMIDFPITIEGEGAVTIDAGGVG